MVTSQQLNINLTDKVSLRVEPYFGGNESSTYLRTASVFFAKSRFNPTERSREAGWQRPGVKEIIQTDENDARLSSLTFCLPFVSLSDGHTYTHTHKPSSFSLYFICSMQPCTPIFLSLPLSLAAFQLFCCHFSSL